MLLWQRPGIVHSSRIAIAGDFLPAMQLPPDATPDWTKIGSGIANYIGDIDAAALNLECCVDTAEGTPQLKLGLGDTFGAARDVLDFPRALRALVIGVANNHAYDYGQLGLNRTVGAIQSAGLTPIGMARNLRERPAVAVIEVGSGQKVGFWAAACHLPEVATQSKAGIEPAFLSRARDALATLAALGSHINIALIHAGMEHTNYPDPCDVALMDNMALAGFDVVAAAHSHRLSGYKMLDRPGRGPAFCFYGLGSLCSSVLYSPLEREGLIVVVAIGNLGEIAQIELRFVHLNEQGIGEIPSDAENAAMQDRFTRVSEEIRSGAYQARFYADVGQGLFQRQLRDVRTAYARGGLNGLAQKLTRIRMRHFKRALHSALG